MESSKMNKNPISWLSLVPQFLTGPLPFFLVSSRVSPGNQEDLSADSGGTGQASGLPKMVAVPPHLVSFRSWQLLFLPGEQIKRENRDGVYGLLIQPVFPKSNLPANQRPEPLSSTCPSRHCSRPHSVSLHLNAIFYLLLGYGV